MTEPAQQSETKSRDEGIEVGVSKLTVDQIAKVVSSVLKGETGARLKAYVETCIHCGLCSEACHYYLSHDNDPHYSPVGKVKQTMWEMIRKKGRVSPEFIKQAAVIAQTECNLCKRCAQYCPFGIDIAYIISVVRRILHRLGATREVRNRESLVARMCPCGTYPSMPPRSIWRRHRTVPSPALAA